MDVELADGTTFYANEGVIGIDGDGRVYTGYDQAMPMDGDEAQGDDPWSHEERLALADLMIERWTKFRAAALG